MTLEKNKEAQFLELRPLLFSLAYRMLGSRADAEDMVQEAYLRWQKAAADVVDSAKAYLTTIVARLSLDSLKEARRKREVYVGPWLPEPLVEPLGAHSYEMAESLSLAFVHLLESLSPPERAAFLLREAFDMPYAEIAAALETSEENCRQLFARARKHIREQRQRFTVDRKQHRRVLEKFLAASVSGNPEHLMALLQQDAVLYSDGGGKVRAALNPIYGADRIARFFAGITRKGSTLGYRPVFALVNGELGILLYGGDRLSSILTLQSDENGLITDIFLIANPDKLPVIAAE